MEKYFTRALGSCRSCIPWAHGPIGGAPVAGEKSGFTYCLVANYPLSKWVITPVINGISRVNPLITGVITHLLSGMSHQVVFSKE